MPVNQVNTIQQKANVEKQGLSAKPKDDAKNKRKKDISEKNLIITSLAIAAIVIGGIMLNKKLKAKEAFELLEKALNHEKDMAKISIEGMYKTCLIKAEGVKNSLLHKIKMRGIVDSSYDVERNINKCKQDYENWLKKLNALKEEYLKKQNDLYESYLRDKKSAKELKNALKDLENELKEKSKYTAPSDYGTTKRASNRFYEDGFDSTYGSGRRTSSSSSSTGERTEAGDGLGSGRRTEAGDGSGSGRRAESGDKPGSGGRAEAGDGSGSGGRAESGDGSGSGGRAESGDGSGSGRRAESGDGSGSGRRAEAGDKPGSGGRRTGGSTGTGNRIDPMGHYTSAEYAAQTGYTEAQWSTLASGNYSSIDTDLYAQFLGITSSEVLTLKLGKSDANAKRLFRELSMKWHPDRFRPNYEEMYGKEQGGNCIEMKIVEAKFNLVTTIYNAKKK